MTRGKYIQISIIMFLYYFAFGTQLPILSLYFTDFVGLSGTETGVILSMGVFGLLLAPIIGSFIADKLLTAERLFSLFQLLSGVFMLALFFQKNFIGILIFYTLYVMVFTQGVTLTNTIVFHNSPSGYFNYGNIRKWGTIGWVVGALVFGGIFQKYLGLDISFALLVSGVISLILGFYSFSLNSTLEKGEKRRDSFIPKSAIEVLKNPIVILLVLVAFLNRYMDSYFYFGIAPYLKSIDIEEALILPIMSFAELSEFITLFFLSKFIKKIGYKRILLIGISSQFVKFTLLIFSTIVFKCSIFVILLGLFFNGLACTFFLFTSYMYLDIFTNDESRAGTFYLFDLFSGVLSKFLGNSSAGFFMDRLVKSSNNYSGFWLVAVMVAITAVVITLFFKDDKKLNLVKNLENK